MSPRILAALAVALFSSCHSFDKWPVVEPPYTAAVTGVGRRLYVQRKTGEAVTIRNPVWEERFGQSFIAGEVDPRPVPRPVVSPGMYEERGSVAVEDIALLRVEPAKEVSAFSESLGGFLTLACIAALVLLGT